MDSALLRTAGYVTTIALHGSVMVTSFSRNYELISDIRVRDFGALQFRYFTSWNFFLQIVHATLGLICDYLEWKNRSADSYRLPKHLRNARDVLFTAIILPATCFTSLTFWTLFNYNRELVLPEYIDKVLSNPANHIIHTCIVPIVLWELMFRARSEPRTHTKRLGYTISYMFVYHIVLFFTYWETGKWLYPVFGLLLKKHITLLIFYVTINCFLMIFFYFAQWKILRYIWGHRSLSKIDSKAE